MILHKLYKIILMILIVFVMASTRSICQPFRYLSNNNELVYIHLDKLIYVAGEPLQYKAYVIDAAKPGHSPCSKVLYFNLSATDGQNIMNWRVNLQDKTVVSSFTLPDTIKSGMYVLTAYTNWMRNGPTASFYNQKLLIMNLSEEIPNPLLVFGQEDADTMHSVKPIQIDNALKLKTSKSTYARDETVQLQIDLESKVLNTLGADLSISVSVEMPFKKLLNEKDIIAYTVNLIFDRLSKTNRF